MLQTFLKIIRRLYPTGRAFRIPVDRAIEGLHQVIAMCFEDVYTRGVNQVLAELLPDNDLFMEAAASTWERRLGIFSSDLTPIEQRRQAISRKLAQPSAPALFHPLTITAELQRAGFAGATVYENTAGGPDPVFQAVEHGDPIAIHGQFSHGANTSVEIIANHIDFNRDFGFIVANRAQAFFIAGPGGPTDPLQIFESRRGEFRELVMILKPLHLVAVLVVDFITDPNWILQDGIWDDEGEWRDEAVWID